jgi:hypothetical protein
MPTDDGFITVSGISIDGAAVEGVALPYLPPLIEFSREPAARDYWWRMMHYVFALPDPSAVPPLPISIDSEEVKKFCGIGLELAQSYTLALGSNVSVFQATPESDLEVAYSLPPKELVAGLCATFRHAYSDREPASYAKVKGQLMRAVRDATDDEAESRLVQLKQWAKAQGALRGHRLKHLVEAKYLGRKPSEWEMNNYDSPSPTESISIFLYGEHLHWDAVKRTRIQEWDSDNYRGPSERLRFLEAVSGLAEFYMGFAVFAAYVSGHPRWVERPPVGM